MASSSKKVTLEVAVKTEQGNIDALDKKLEDTKRKAAELKQQKIQMKFDADTQALDAATQKVKQAESNLAQLRAMQFHWNFNVDDSDIKVAEQEVDRLKQDQINLQLQVEEYKLDELQSKKDAIEADEINVQLNNQTAMQGLEQIADGFSRIKSAASEVGQQFGDLLSSAGKQETNFAFLKNAVGDAETARQKMSEINDIVAQLPGDDTALQGLLSSAVAKDSSLTAENLRSMANSATDYFSAMSFYGKSATEAQQDMTNYILSGNTAELERSPILQGHIDKLKEATTVQERSKALAEALNAEHWGGMGAMDTYNNKLETFNGMIERGRYTLGGMFQEGAKGAMDFLLKLDEGTNGLVGMTIAAAGFLSPVTDAVMGLGQMATGINAIKDSKLGEWAGTVKDKISGIGSSIRNVNASAKFDSLKSSLTNIASSAKSAAVSLGTTLKSAVVSVGSAMKTAALSAVNLGRSVLTAGYNALKAAGMWLVEKAQLVASTIAKGAATVASYALAVAEWLAASPILLVVVAVVALIAILWYLYNTNESVRNAIDGFAQALWNLGGTISGALMGAFAWLQGAWQNTVDFFTNGASTISDTVGGAFTWLSEGLQWFADIITGSVMGAVQWLTDGLQWLSDLINGSIMVAVQWLTDQFTWLKDSFQLAADTIMTYAPLIAQILFIMATGGVGAILLLIANFMGMPNQVGGALQNVINRVASFVGDIVGRMASGATNAVSNFVSGIASLPDRVYSELQRTLDRVMEWGGQIVSRLGEIAQRAWQAFVSGLGIGSPGYIQILTLKELDDTGRRVPQVASRIVDNLGHMAGEAVDAWGTPKFGYSIDGFVDNKSSIQTNGIHANNQQQPVNNITFNLYGDMDSEERMQKFLDYVTEYLDWDNNTAGRNMEVL